MNIPSPKSEIRNPKYPKPPRWANRFFEWYCAPELREDLQGDLYERFYLRLQEKSLFLAKLYFVLDVFNFFRPYTLKRKRSNHYQPQYRWLYLHYLKIAFRNVNKDKKYLTINTLGLALGIACSLLLIAYTFSELSFDRHFENSNRIYRISCSTVIDGVQTDFAPIPPAIGLAVKETLPEIEAMARLIHVHGNTVMTYEDKSFYQSHVFFADSTIFNVFSYQFIIGDKQALQGPDKIVLTHSLAEKVFGTDYMRDENILDKQVLIGEQPFDVSAIIEDVPYNTHFRPAALIGWHGYGNDDVWDDSHAYTYARFGSAHNPTVIQEKLNTFVAENENIRYVAENFGAQVAVFIQPLSEIHLYSHKMYELSANGNLGYIYAFALIAIFFLISSGINYTNLAIAASVHRYKEIGVRKVMGALQHQIQKQFITESALMTLLATSIGLFFFYLLMPQFNQLMDYELNIALLFNTTFLLIVFLVVVLLSLLSGFYPAFYLSLINPIRVFKNKLDVETPKVPFRKMLLITQFFISSIMIVAVITVSQQMSYLRDKDLGFNKENIMIITLHGPQMRDLPTLKDEVLKISGVSGAARAEYIPGLSSMIDEHKVERANGEMKSSTVARIFFDKDYLKLLGLPVVEGRNFDPDNPADVNHSFLVNEAAVKAYGWDKTPEGAIGKKIDGFNYGKKGEVIGVVKDVNLFSLKHKIEPLIMNLSDWGGHLYVKMDGGNFLNSISNIENTYKRLFQNQPMEYQFLDERFDKLYDADKKMNAALMRGAQLLIFISCLGLFGLSAFMVTQRTKEIGVRKVFGASVQEIMVLLSRDYVKLILIANGIAMPVAYIGINQWLEGYAYRINFSAWLLFIPVMVTIGLALVSISYQLAKASRTNPVNVLKSE